MKECTVAVTHSGAATIATLTGELTLVSSRGVGRELEAALEPDSELVVLDLSGLSYLDSAGIELVFRVSRLVGSWGGRLRLVVPTESAVYRIMRIVDPAGSMPICETAAEALGAGGSGPTAGPSVSSGRG